MVKIAILVLFAAVLLGVAVEVHCRLQLRMISRPRTLVNLIKHYLLTLPVISIILLFVIEVRELNLVSGLSKINKSLMDLGCLIIFLLPLIYIMDRRYPKLISKREGWRKKHITNE